MYDKGWIYRVGVMCLCAAVGSYILYTCLSGRDSAPAGNMVSVPLSRLTELQSLINRQEQRLNQLQELLSGQSSGLSQQQQQISQLRQELTTAKSSLTSSDKIIDEQNASLMSLSEELRQEQRRTQRIERQRLLWQAVAGGVVLYAVLKE